MTEDAFLQPLRIGDASILPREKVTVQVPVGHLISHELISITVHVCRGSKPGPRLLVTAGLHGDEINGVEVVRRLLRRKFAGLAGDLIMVPIVNLPAFLARSRYLPDRRDLNRLFPGSKSGSLGARLARRLLEDVSKGCTHAIDLHTGADNRPNLPQVRFDDEDVKAKEMAESFGAPVMMHSPLRPGSFRECLAKRKVPQVVYEGGQARLLEPAPVQLAIRGTLAVMASLGMIKAKRSGRPSTDSVFCHQSYWERAPRGGLFLPSVKLGDTIDRGQPLGNIGDPLGKKTTQILAQHPGVVIGQTRDAVVDEGDGIFHIGSTHRVEDVADSIEAAEDHLEHGLDHVTFDEPLG